MTDRAQKFLQRLSRLRIEVDLDDPLIFPRRDRPQAAFLLVQMRKAFGCRNVHELALRTKKPAMIRTDEATTASLVFPGQFHPTMRADIMEGADLVVLASHDQRGYASNVDPAHEPIAWTWQQIGRAHV